MKPVFQRTCEDAVMNPSFPLSEVAAMIWDYDGTLVDTRRKNFNVTRTLVKHIAGIDPSTVPALQSLETYTSAQARSTNWRDFYEREFGLSQGVIDETGRAWSAFQLADRTPVQVFDGISSVLRRLRHLRHGIVSQNSRSTIAHVLDKHDLQGYFHSIVGYEEVDLHMQKPAPDGLLQCIDKVMHAPPGLVLYVGDHETDAACARNANEVFRRIGRQIHVVSIAALYSPLGSLSEWSVRPDFQARTTREIAVIAESLSVATEGLDSPAGKPIH